FQPYRDTSPFGSDDVRSALQQIFDQKITPDLRKIHAAHLSPVLQHGGPVKGNIPLRLPRLHQQHILYLSVFDEQQIKHRRQERLTGFIGFLIDPPQDESPQKRRLHFSLQESGRVGSGHQRDDDVPPHFVIALGDIEQTKQVLPPYQLLVDQEHLHVGPKSSPGIPPADVANGIENGIPLRLFDV